MERVIWSIVEIGNSGIEIGLILLFLSKMLKPRFYMKHYYVLTFLLSWLLLSFANYLNSEPVISIGVTTTILLTVSFVLYKASIGRTLFLDAIFLVIILVSECVLIGVLTLLGLSGSDVHLTSETGHLIGIFGTKIMSFWIIVYLYKFAKKKIKELNRGQWLTMILMPFISILLMQIIYKLILYTPKSTNNQMLAIIAMLGVLYINFAVFNHFESYANMVRLNVLEQVLKNEKQNYKLLNNAYDEMRILRHDVDNHLNIIYDLICNSQIKSSKEYLKKILKNPLNTSNYCYTGNLFIDSVINLKCHDAMDKNIQFISKMKISREIEFESVPICKILNNALDNAIEECERLSNYMKFIEISMAQINNKLVIVISNSSSHVDIESMQTKKTDKNIHGIGLLSMSSAVKELDGIMNYSYKDHVFTINIVLLEQNKCISRHLAASHANLLKKANKKRYN